MEFCQYQGFTIVLGFKINPEIPFQLQSEEIDYC